MAVTGSGTQADPFIVHSYTEFISLSGTLNNTTYIQFFDTPNQVIDCNTYGSEFKWHAFVPSNGNQGTATIYINLNGCTIKNFLIADGETMFKGQYWGSTAHLGKISISNGFLRNVFMGSATSKLFAEYVEWHDVSISINVAGSTVIPFGHSDLNTESPKMDNCAIYLVTSTLTNHLMKKVDLSDTDIELHVTDQNRIKLFPDCSFTDCRVQGKISGTSEDAEGSNRGVVFGVLSSNYNARPTQWTNCVFDVDLTEINTPSSFQPLDVIYSFSTGINTNVICKSHYPTGKTAPSAWNYMTHENIRNGAYLNNAGFTVVELVGS